MGELKENQLLLLDNLIYLKDVAKEGVNERRVEEVVDWLLDGGLKEAMKDNGTEAAYMSEPEWKRILLNIQADRELMNLRITNAKDNYGKFDKVNPITDENGNLITGGIRAACFVDSENNATVVFRGTGGPIEWHDNGVGGYSSETYYQKEALEYIEGLTEYDNITVTGHSKGGNKSQFVAIMSDKVDRCVSFDGQGFSMEFMASHKDLILKNSSKITCIADEYDFVNCMLFPLPLPEGQRIYIKSPYTHKLEEFHHNHCPNTMLTADGQLNRITEPSVITKLVSAITKHANAVIQEPDRSYIIDGMLANFEGGFADESGEQIEVAI